MKTRIFSILFLLPLLLTLSCKSNRSGKQDSPDPGTQPRNIIFIVVDDLNNTIGCYGHPLVKTPNIDRLAKQGLLFRKAYNNFAVCNPSRSSFLTGLRPETLGILNNRVTLKSVLGDRVTLPALFRGNGYHTISIGKVFNGNSARNDSNAWDEEYHFGPTELGRQGNGRNLTGDELQWCRWLEAEGTDEDQADGKTAAKAVEFIRKDHGKPFFMGLGFGKPHDPFHAPKKYYESYPPEVCTPPVLPDGWTPAYDHSLPGETRVFNQFTETEKREFLRSYYACTSFMDAQLGKVLDALEEEGLMDNTLIVFFGDHGYHLGEHNWWNKVTVYEKSHNAPLIISTGNREIAGKETNAMVEFLDLYPTLASVFRLDGVPDYLEGRSFDKVLENPDMGFREHVNILTLRGKMMGRSVKTDKWRYIEWDNGTMGVELYDQEKDPLEYQNLASQPGFEDVIQEMRQLILKP